MHRMGTVIIAKEPLPDAVYRSQKDKILISATYFEKGTSKVVLSTSGTGFVPEISGLVITVRHLIKFEADYDYLFMGTIITDLEWINFPLYLVAKGETGTYKDIIVLRPDPITMEKAWGKYDLDNPNPYRMLLKTSELVDAKVDGKKVYISGFSSGVGEYLEADKQPTPILIDLVNFTFSTEITASITSMPVNRVGIKKLLRLSDGVEQGFSGGKVMNENGQVIGMTIAMSDAENFTFAFSSQDIKQFFKDHNLK